MILESCAQESVMPRAQAPAIPDAQSRCRAAATNESPLITEWSSAEKANLQARLRSGGLAVEFSGCGMRPLTGCTLRGSYRWQRTTISSEAIQIRNQDELFAKLPLGALALEGELARSGRLEVRTMVSGQYVLEGSTAADVPDYGDCAQATHLLVAVSIGSFKLNSGGTLEMGGGAAMGPASTGAHSSSSEVLLRESGDVESCKLSTDELPNIGCSSPIQAFLVPLPRFAKERGSGTLRVTFAAATSDRAWELRSQQQFVCRTPCTRWINPSEPYELRTESGPEFETVQVPDLAPFVGSNGVEVRARPSSKGAFIGGIVTTGLGGGLAFIGGFLALGGALSDRNGLLVAGGVTSTIGLLAIAPGVYLIVSSGSKAELRAAQREVSGVPTFASPHLGLRGEF
jgi:hypothetical protein